MATKKEENISYSYAAAAISALFAIMILVLVSMDVLNGRGAQDVILAVVGLFFGGLSVAGFKWPDKMAGVFDMLGKMGKNMTDSTSDDSKGSTNSTMEDTKANGGSVIVQGPVKGDINVHPPPKEKAKSAKEKKTTSSGGKSAKGKKRSRD